MLIKSRKIITKICKIVGTSFAKTTKMDPCRELASIELRRPNRSIHHAWSASPDPAQDVQNWSLTEDRSTRFNPLGLSLISCAHNRTTEMWRQREKKTQREKNTWTWYHYGAAEMWSQRWDGDMRKDKLIIRTPVIGRNATAELQRGEDITCK